MTYQGFCAPMAIVVLGSWSSITQAAVTPYSNHQDWLDAVGDPGAVTTIGFNEFPEFTVITDQYEDEGVTFFGSIDTTRHIPNAFPNDEWGLDGNGDINVSFERPIHWIAADWPGDARDFELYRNGQKIAFWRFNGDDFYGNFSGLYSSDAFDAAVIISSGGGEAFIDDLHFVIPAPGSFFPLCTLLLFRRRSRNVNNVTELETRHSQRETLCQTPSN